MLMFVGDHLRHCIILWAVFCRMSEFEPLSLRPQLGVLNIELHATYYTTVDVIMCFSCRTIALFFTFDIFGQIACFNASPSVADFNQLVAEMKQETSFPKNFLKKQLYFLEQAFSNSPKRTSHKVTAQCSIIGTDEICSLLIQSRLYLGEKTLIPQFFSLWSIKSCVLSLQKSYIFKFTDGFI